MPTIRLSPADLARLGPAARQAVAGALSDHLGAPVAVGDVEAAPPAEAEAVPQAAPAPRLWPWVRGVGLAVLGIAAVSAGMVAWAMRPQPGIPAGNPDLPPAAVRHASAPPASATSATTQAAPQKAQPSGDPGAHATAPAQVLPNPPAPGATICHVVAGVYVCGWVQAG